VSEMEEAIVSHLGADSGVLAIIGPTDIHAGMAPQGAEPPYVVYQMISCPDLHLANYLSPRLQFACWESSYAKAVVLAKAVRACFDSRHLTVLGVHFHSWADNVMDGDFVPELERFSRIVDVRLYYRDPT